MKKCACLIQGSMFFWFTPQKMKTENTNSSFSSSTSSLASRGINQLKSGNGLSFKSNPSFSSRSVGIAEGKKNKKMFEEDPLLLSSTSSTNSSKPFLQSSNPIKELSGKWVRGGKREEESNSISFLKEKPVFKTSRKVFHSRAPNSPELIYTSPNHSNPNSPPSFKKGEEKKEKKEKEEKEEIEKIFKEKIPEGYFYTNQSSFITDEKELESWMENSTSKKVKFSNFEKSNYFLVKEEKNFFLFEAPNSTKKQTWLEKLFSSQSTPQQVKFNNTVLTLNRSSIDVFFFIFIHFSFLFLFKISTPI